MKAWTGSRQVTGDIEEILHEGLFSNYERAPGEAGLLLKKI
jgi:hypothetical protein